MPSFKTAFPSKYLAAEDIGSTRPIVTIADCEFQDVGKGSDIARKLVIKFKDGATVFATPTTSTDRARVLEALASKLWILNKTNGETIAEICNTEDFEEWQSHRIELFTVRVDYQGKRTLGIRCAATRLTKADTKRATPPVAVPVAAEDDDVVDNNDDVGF